MTAAEIATSTLDELWRAPLAPLNATPRSERARALAEHIGRAIAAWERATPRPDGSEPRKRSAAFVAAVSALTADLLRETGADRLGMVGRQLEKTTFTGRAVGYRVFVAAVSGMEALGFVEVLAATNWPKGYEMDCGAVTYVQRSPATRFRATEALVKLAAGFGITPDNLRPHYARPLPERVVTLSGTSTWVYGQRVDAEPMEVPECAEVERIAAQVHAINAFLANVEIDGANHDGFHRAFHTGDQQGFAWNKGGRLYSPGLNSYQQLAQKRRLAMRLRGEPVVEIDIKASHVVVAHGITRTPLDVTGDPYAIEGLPRSIVKDWVTATFGNGKPLRRWPDRMRERYAARNGMDLETVAPAEAVAEQIMTKHPLLSRLGDLGVTWADLQFAESEAVIGTMQDLMAEGTPSLPVHDSLICPASAAGRTKELLEANFHRVVGIVPRLEAQAPSEA